MQFGKREMSMEMGKSRKLQELGESCLGRGGNPEAECSPIPRMVSFYSGPFWSHLVVTLAWGWYFTSCSCSSPRGKTWLVHGDKPPAFAMDFHLEPTLPLQFKGWQFPPTLQVLYCLRESRTKGSILPCIFYERWTRRGISLALWQSGDVYSLSGILPPVSVDISTSILQFA